jgi:N-methylhydantoinase A
VVDLAEVGAGGGSIASVDSGGALRVGPRSSGSVPGPACYGTGGTDATVTDADLVLGHLREGELSGGVSLSAELAREAIRRHVAEPLGHDVVDAAWAIHEIANANMAAAIRMVTVQRGIDPRDFSLVGFGGAGPMHVARLAETFGIDTVVVPWGAGVASAVGLVVSDLSVEEVRTRLVGEGERSVTLVQSLFDELEAAGAAALPPADHEAAAYEVIRSVDARYQGQAHQLTVGVPGGPLTDDDLAAVVKGFAARHEQVYGVPGDGPVELVSFRARVVRVVAKHRPVARDEVANDGAEARLADRPVYAADAGRHVATPVYDWSRLRPGAGFGGPAVVEAPDTVVVVPPGWRASVDRWRDLVLHTV